ncbi:MAG: glycoside hydrolase family 15 protein [Anaerolineaceae bacterium]|nr:glycoside hydrolase family 15 protein [Anaerolineaceae bacterium]
MRNRNTEALISKSIDVILDNQSVNGAFIASPNFPTYHYSWIRDGSYIADALKLWGKDQAANKFHHWVAEIVLRRKGLIESAISKLQAGEALAPHESLHTRYTLQGHEGMKEAWPNLQHDGFGTWLWVLERFLKDEKDASAELLEAGDLTARYLEAIWTQPCYDSWEEFPDYMHTYTLACIFGGLERWSWLRGRGSSGAAQAIRTRVLREAVADGHFIKSIGIQGVDGNLLAVSTLYALVPATEPIFRNTLKQIEEEICWNFGVQRYKTDTYYGGGLWLLLSAWLGLAYVALGEQEKAACCLAWIERQCNAALELPEQVAEHVNSPKHIQEWTQRWGPVATPLLWSHANYLILAKALEKM